MSWWTKDNLCRFKKILCNTLTPYGTLGATSGYRDIFRTLIFGSLEHLGVMYGGNRFLVSDSSSSSCGSSVVACPFFFLFLVCFHHDILDGPCSFKCDFQDDVTRNFLSSWENSAHRWTYPPMSSMISIGDIVVSSDSKIVLVLEIEITML